jgi:hypothetical protein
MQAIKEEVDLPLIDKLFVGFFSAFFLQTELLLYQNIMMMGNTFLKSRQIKTSQSKKTNQMTTAFVE